MSASLARVRPVTVDLPDEAFEHRAWNPQEIAGELRNLWLLEEVRARRLGFGKAAELACIPVAQFLVLMGKRNITPFDYDEEELARELQAAT
jgi:predicted HTH domain antitoxin